MLPRIHLRLIGGLAILLAFTGLTLTGLHSAQAASPARRDCVLDATSGAERCFGNYRVAVSFATDGAINDAPLSAHSAVTDQAFAAKLTKLSTHVTQTLGADTIRPAAATEAEGDHSIIGATLFTGTSYTGDSETIRIPKPCVKDGHYDDGFILGTVGRAAASVQPWANCWIWLHSGDTWDSPRQGPYETDTADLGDWKGRGVLMGLS
jgi:hypothetical protein